MENHHIRFNAQQAVPYRWNQDKLSGQEPSQNLNEVWVIRIRLQIADKKCDLAPFNLALEKKLHSCNLVELKANSETLTNM